MFWRQGRAIFFSFYSLWLNRFSCSDQIYEHQHSPATRPLSPTNLSFFLQNLLAAQLDNPSLGLVDVEHPDHGMPVCMFCFHSSSLTCVYSNVFYYCHCCQCTSNSHAVCILSVILYSYWYMLCVYLSSIFVHPRVT